MIIDIILDRREGAINYVPATHLKAIYDYATDAGMNDIAAAVDGGTEDDVKAALMDYVISGGCNPDIHHHNFLDLCLFIKAVRWTEGTEETEKTEEDAPTAAVAADKLAIIRKDEIHEHVSIQNAVSIKLYKFNAYKVRDLIENTERFRARLSDCTTTVPTCEPKTEPYVRSNSIRVFRERAVQYYGTNSDSFTLYTDRNFMDIPTPLIVLFSK